MAHFLLITGNDEDAIRIKACEASIRMKAMLGDENAFEIVSSDKDKQNPLTTFENFLDTLTTPSFLCEKRGIWLKHVSFFEELPSGNKDTTIDLMLQAVIEQLDIEVKCDTTSVFIDGPNLKKENTLYNFFQNHGKIIELNKINANKKNFKSELGSKIKQYAAKYDKKITYDALEYLTSTLGTNSGVIFSELDKIIAFTGNSNSITLENCKIISSQTPEMAGWSFAEAIFSRNKKEAILSLNILLDKAKNEKGNTQELSMLYAAARKIKDIIKIKVASELLGLSGTITFQKFQNQLEKNEKESIPEIFAHVHPYRAYKLYECSLKFDNKFLAEALSKLLDVNISLVSGAIDKRLVMENMINKIC